MVSPAIQPGSCSPDRTSKIEHASAGAALFSGVSEPTGNGMSSVDKAKPFDIPKREVWEAFKKAKANHGAAGVDGQKVVDVEADLANLFLHYAFDRWMERVLVQITGCSVRGFLELFDQPFFGGEPAWNAMRR